jgi:hypothetical protein
MNSGGDVLARGAKSATFSPAKGISQARWDAMWEPEEPEEPQSRSQEKRLKVQKNLISAQKTNTNG